MKQILAKMNGIDRDFGKNQAESILKQSSLNLLLRVENEVFKDFILFFNSVL